MYLFIRLSIIVIVVIFVVDVLKRRFDIRSDPCAGIIFAINIVSYISSGTVTKISFLSGMREITDIVRLVLQRIRIAAEHDWSYIAVSYFFDNCSSCFVIRRIELIIFSYYY